MLIQLIDDEFAAALTLLPERRLCCHPQAFSSAAAPPAPKGPVSEDQPKALAEALEWRPRLSSAEDLACLLAPAAACAGARLGGGPCASNLSVCRSGLPSRLHPPSPPSLPTPPTPSLPCSRVRRHCPYRATPAVRRGHGPALRPAHRRRPHLAAGAALQGAPRLLLPRISGLCCCCADPRHYHFYKLLCQPTSLLERTSTVQLFAVSAC